LIVEARVLTPQSSQLIGQLGVLAAAREGALGFAADLVLPLV